MKPSASLDNWRDYFRRGDSDIFGIIDHAIMVAAADSPQEFKSRRARIAELLFSCKVSRCVGCDHLELSIAGEEEANHCRKTVERAGGVGGGGRDVSVDAKDDGGVDESNKLNNNQLFSKHTCVTVDEVIRIKDILLNKEDEPKTVLLDSLRKLESMSMTVDVLKDTEIGKAVNALRRHGSDKISKLSKALFAKWKELVDQWMNSPKEIAGAEGTPESANFSVVDEAEAFPSPPHDLDFLAHEPSGFELSQILDSLDCDGNLRHSVEPKHETKSQSGARRRPEGTNEANVVGRRRPECTNEANVVGRRRPEGTNEANVVGRRRPEGTNEANVVGRRRPGGTNEANVVGRRRPEGTNEANVVERYNKNQQMRREEVDVRPVFDEPRRQPKQSREQMVREIQRKPIVVAEQKRKLAGSQQDKLKALDPDAKFEFAKRKLQESYQQHEKAKRQRTIQVLETIPKQSKSQKPLHKRPPRR